MGKDWIALLWSRSQKRFRIPVNVDLDDISSAAEPSVTKLGMVMHRYEPDHLSKDWFAGFKVKVTVKDNVIEIWLFNILSELLILLQLNLVLWRIIISQIVL